MQTTPTFESFLYPLLELAANGEVRVRESADVIAKGMVLTEDAMRETTKGGNALKYIDRTYWSATYLRQAGLLASSRRGFVVVTEEGKKVLASAKTSLNRKDLQQYESFANFAKTKSKKIDAAEIDVKQASALTPEEQIGEAVSEISKALSFEILDRIYAGPPVFFERVIVDLLVSMGYGDFENAQLTGKSGDNGIDGVINQDQLGLDRVYIQAKRYEKDNKVGADHIRNFAGSLGYHQAAKGIFVTTSSFTASAMDTAEKVGQRIVLIDGEQLTKLMIENGVGCAIKRSLKIMKIDEDYYDY